MEELEKLEKQGRRRLNYVKCWTLFCFLIVLCVTSYAFTAKNKLIADNDLDAHNALSIDLLGAVLFTQFLGILLFVLITFKMLERDYSIKIRKPQLAVTFVLGINTAIIGSLQLYSGQLQLQLYDKSDCLGHPLK